jgi:hypothetical protein
MKLELSLQGHSCWHTQASWRPQDDGGATAAVEGIESHHESQRNSRNLAKTVKQVVKAIPFPSAPEVPTH